VPGESYLPHARKYTWSGPRSTWGPPRKKIDDTLSLQQIVYLRRLHDGESPADIARALGTGASTVSKALKRARARFDVATNAELLALPKVIGLLLPEGGDGG
jgi:DNA-binding CsgD family transcriptional regulator